MSKILVVLIFVISSINIYAQGDYKSIDNQGMSKSEKFEVIDKYLQAINQSVKSLESKLDENGKKIKNLDEMIVNIKKEMKELKDASQDKLGEVKDGKTKNPELDKLKNELEALKSKDIEKLHSEVQGLSDTVKSLMALMKSQKY